jgi:hypothetical protein
MEKLQELFEYLKENYKNLTEDLRFEEFGEIDEEQELSGQYVCCEQKLIWYKDGGYIMACLYNSHPTMKYDTKEEVKDFLQGNNYLETSVLDYKGNIRIGELNSKAYNDGVYAHLYYSVANNKKQFDLNVAKQILFKPGLVSTISVTTENI